MEKLDRFSSLSFLKISFLSLFSVLFIPSNIIAQISSVDDALSAIRDGEEDSPQIPHIYFSISATNGTSDECVLAFLDEATSDYEWTYDALKMESFNTAAIEMALVTTDSNLLTVDARPFDSEGFEVPIYLDIPAAGTYSFFVGDVVNMPYGTCLYIEDLISGNTIQAESGQTLSIVSNSSYTGNRLLLHASATAAITSQNISCGNIDNGIVDIIIPGPGLSFVLSSGQSQVIASNNQSQTISELPAGEYQLELFYADEQCSSKTQSISISNPDLLSAQLTWHRVDLCNTADNGAVLIENTSGSELTYTITNNSGVIAATGPLPAGPTLIQGLSADIYHIESDGTCPLNITIDLNDPEALPAIGYEVIPALCNDANSGSLTVFASENEYNFHLLNSSQEIIYSGSSGDIISQLTAGNYTLSAFKSSLLCPAVNISFEVIQLDSITASVLNVQKVLCNEGENGAFQIATNASPGFDYSVFNSLGTEILSGHVESSLLNINALVADVYTVGINSACGTQTLYADLTDSLALSTQILGGDVIIILADDQEETVYIEHDGSADDSDTSWSLSNGFENADYVFTYSFNTPGAYELILENSNDHCTATDTIQIIVSEITGIENSEKESLVTVIQTEDDITFSFHGEDADISGVSIFDITGKMVWAAGVNGLGNKKITTSTAQFSSGTYIAVCNSSNRFIFNSKFIIR